eukprot:Seg447.3 transcript_id=Seg447.3/GoldUCD/mRNA.D3Y31 product=Mitoferrin-1 protein_id=Seg447.3/GoldUCD/D3Y31
MEMSSEFGQEHIQESITSRLRGLRPDEINADMLAADPEISTANTTQTVKLETYIMAGAAAGIMEHCVMYPVDCVKTRMQCLRPSPGAIYSGINDAFKKMVRTEGALSPFRGMNIVALGAGPAHALYFSSYEKTKTLIGSWGHGNHSSTVSVVGAGVVATLFHDAAMNPIDFVKQRLQMFGSPYRGVFHCFRTVIKEEGIRAFYRSYTTQLTMNIPFQCVHFVTYEGFRKKFNPEGGYHARTHVLAGGLAGAIAAATTTPLDVAKTLLNTQEKCVVCEIQHADTRVFLSGMVNALKMIYKLEGVGGYFRGLQARVIYQMPSCAICWSVYEFFKHRLSLTPEQEAEWMENAI